MMPWEHAIIGYIGYSIIVRLFHQDPPTSVEAAIVIFASLLPDLIDKPLAWQFGLLSSGISVAHSILVGVPLAFALGIGLWIRDRPELGGALAIGYGSHVSGDLLFATLFSRPPILPSFMWPLYTTPATAPSGFGLKLWELLLNSQALLGSSMGRTYFVLEAVLLVATLALWLSDGAPGLGPVRAFVSSLR